MAASRSSRGRIHNVRGFKATTCPLDSKHTHVFKTWASLNDHLRHSHDITPAERKALLDGTIDTKSPSFLERDEDGKLKLVCPLQASHNQVFSFRKFLYNHLERVYKLGRKERLSNAESETDTDTTRFRIRCDGVRIELGQISVLSWFRFSPLSV